MSDVVVIGGGVSGVFTTYCLASQGVKVTLLEGATVGSAASYGNAGMLVPSYSVPMSHPSSLVMGLKALVHKEDAIKIGFRLEPAFWQWLARFIAASRPTRMLASTAVLCAMSTASIRLYDDLFALHPDAEACVGFKRTGWLYAYRTEAGLRSGLAQARLVGRSGVSWQRVSDREVHELEPGLARGLAGGIFYPGDCSLQPYRLVQYVARLAREYGATIKTGVTVRSLQVENYRVRTAVTRDGEVAAGTFVAAVGALTSRLLRHVAPGLPIQPAKGYSITCARSAGSPRMPINLAESHVVVSPLGEQLRLTGGLDLVGLDRAMDTTRVAGLALAARSWLPGLQILAPVERWLGFRPMTPDGLPLIGPLQVADNLIVATGHGTLGVTLGPITGQLVADLVTGTSIPPPMEPVLPRRFGY